MYERTLRYGKGYSGKLGNKCWIAAIHGTSNQYGLQRAFIEPDKIEREHFNRPRTMIDCTWSLDVGLYEASEGGERWFFVVNIKDGEHKAFRPDEERVKAMAKLMDDGMSAEEARKATRPVKS
ncbi:MAG: hypothetical protein IT514_15485 [Burkholderiales bacterium]|nr:hypothetical protein [Burkholderiales bacterium]